MEWVKMRSSSKVQWLGNLSWGKSTRKKNLQGFPHVFTFENFNNSLYGRSKAVAESSLASSSSPSS
jgi:hypothetical protein